MTSCTSECASWCPVCGDCTCPLEQWEQGEVTPECPLHGEDSKHAREIQETCPVCDGLGSVASGYHPPMRRYKILPTLQAVAGDDGRPNWCIVTCANPNPETSDEDGAFEVEGTTKDVLNFFDTGSCMVRAVMVTRGEPDPHVYVHRDAVAELVRQKFWNLAELHGERAPEELAAMILGLAPPKDQEHQ